MATLRTKTIRRAFDTRLTDLATNTTLGTATRHDFAAITLDVPETGSRTFKSVVLRMTFRDAFAVANEVTGVRMGIKLGAVAFADTDRSFTQANTADHLFDCWDLDVTDYFNTNFGAGASQTCQGGIAVSSTAAALIGGHITGELIVTFEFDDDVGTQRVKTVPILIQSHHTTLTAAQQEIGTTGGVTNAPANQIPALDTYLEESGKGNFRAYIQIEANDNGVAATNFTPFVQIDAVAEVGRALITQTLITAMRYRDNFIYDTTAFATNAAHAFKMRCDLTARLSMVGAIMYVTFTYDKSTSTRVTCVKEVPMTSPGSDFVGIRRGLSHTSNVAADAARFSCEFDIEEPGAITLKQSGIQFVVPEISSGGAYQLRGGAQGYRTYTPPSTVCEVMGVHRADHSAGAWALARGVNKLDVDTYNGVNGNRQFMQKVLAIVVYSADVPTQGTEVASRSVAYVNSVYGTTPALTVDLAAAGAGQRFPSMGASRRIDAVYLDGFYRSAANQPAAYLAEIKAGEFHAGGFEVFSPTSDSSVLGELASWALFAACTRSFNRDDLHTGKLEITTARRNVFNCAISAGLASWLTFVNFHQVTYTVAGVVTVGGAAVADGKTVKIFALDAAGVAELVLSVVTAGGAGGFTAQVPDNTRTYWASYADGANLGRSADGTPTTGASAFNIAIGGSADVTPPVITVISPTPGVAPGAPGGFPADWLTARSTPIVLTVTDIAPGLQYVALIATLPGGVEEVVYRRGAFKGKYAALSTVSVIANGFQFSVRHADGWPPGTVTFNVDPIDAAGNLAA